ncbi:MAG: hypothetical protein HY695_31270 [Deltaproteobacteria bacterium]|nr:hypothetical protein [Deltaproteobacteria bacterium]
MAENNEQTKTGVLRRLWEGWKRLGKKIGDFQARLLLIIFYYVVLAPFALAVRWGSDPLGIKAGRPRGWTPRGESEAASLATAIRQF